VTTSIHAANGQQAAGGDETFRVEAAERLGQSIAENVVGISVRVDSQATTSNVLKHKRAEVAQLAEHSPEKASPTRSVSF
jgi:hypothetical protein